MENSHKNIKKKKKVREAFNEIDAALVHRPL